ncbi:uncharacterized protein LOC129169842 [Dunckerocampus dactyliophorus]|uniref:uncharacterized protein LOC129169842 n=1 Tax=Dunckerocampus dactyliophorus TaxID=161453 RepID=UPI002406AE87|nr:uncharacterized protein LOC129169842 [Dunckerocampus dactyliophorus]XP_054612671.1 uncharacterized protein LOC129169842 [Dunckerocampus dactyliophorus]
MFPKGHLGGQDGTHTKEVPPHLSMSPKGGLNQDNAEGNDRLESHLDSDTVCMKAVLIQSRKNSVSDCQSGIEAVKDTIPRLIKRINSEDSKDDEDECSSNIVDHILKELKGINKIQEEISDLRQYLTSVRGSVDEVSCCVDAVLSEIEELYSGASAPPNPSPVSQTRSIRRGSLGRQNAITSPLKRDSTTLSDWKECGNISGGILSHRTPKHLTPSHISFQSDHQTNQENALQSSIMQILCSAKQEQGLHQSRDNINNSFLSSHHCPDTGFVDPANDKWPSEDHQYIMCEAGDCSEEEISSCANSGEELHMWDCCATEETQSSTPGHSSHTSSEHLSLLFGIHYNSPSCSPTLVDSRNKGLRNDGKHLACVCSVNYPYSRSSGYHTVETCANAEDQGSSMSGSCSTVLLTDCDDGYLETQSLCEDCPSSGDTLELGSAASLDRDWTDHSISRDEAGESLNSSEIDSESTDKSPRVGFDVTTFSKAVLSFRSALKGALKKFEGFNPEDLEDDSTSEASLSLIRHTDEATEVPRPMGYTEGEVSLIDNRTQFVPTKETSTYVDYGETNEKLSCSSEAFPQEPDPSPSTPTEGHNVDILQSKECETDLEMYGLEVQSHHCPSMQGESPSDPLPSSDEVCLNSTNENNVAEETGKPIDANHKARIANFQRILKEKRQTHYRVSQSAQGSLGSHGSQGSQGSRSQEKYIQETVQEEHQVDHILIDCIILKFYLVFVCCFNF